MAMTEYHYYADAYKFGGTFKLGDTSWEGEAWIGYQDSWREYDGRVWRLSKMQAA